MTRTSVLVLALAACGGVDEVVPERGVHDAPVPVPDALVLPVGDVATFEAIGKLSALRDRLDSYVVDDRYPNYIQGFTPGATCCATGGRCPANRAAWEGLPAWEAIDFWIEEPHRCVYSYTAGNGGTEIWVTARGDLDCDGTFGDIILHCVRAPGESRCTLSGPKRD